MNVQFIPFKYVVLISILDNIFFKLLLSNLYFVIRFFQVFPVPQGNRGILKCPLTQDNVGLVMDLGYCIPDDNVYCGEGTRLNSRGLYTGQGLIF